MAPSQLKRLKASLRDHGIVGPQKSKKQKKQTGKAGLSKEKRVQHNAALQGIRDQFNPFEVKVPARGSKYEFTNSNFSARAGKGLAGRPGVTKGLGEETRRKTLLVEMQRCQKVGGIKDRRFGEDDPTMTPEEKALERFIKEKQGGGRKGKSFDLEDDDGDQMELTHLGRSLSFADEKQLHDSDKAGLSGSDDDEVNAEGESRSRKRPRLSPDDSERSSSLENEIEDVPKTAKTKQEVMKEVIAKSKLHKYERQKIKEDDDDLRAELDQGLSDIYTLMRGTKAPQKSRENQDLKNVEAIMNPDRAALLNGKERSVADKEYDERLRQMAFDARSKPTERTKTEEERLYDEAQRLKELEEKRLARMRGEHNNGDVEEEDERSDSENDEDFTKSEGNSRTLEKSMPLSREYKMLEVEDEDDFVLDDNLVASGSEVDLSDDASNSSSLASLESDDDDDDKEFTGGLLSKEDIGRDGLYQLEDHQNNITIDGANSILAYTYPCPETHEQWIQIAQNVPAIHLPTVIQRIRALYHPSLSSENKAKLEKFSGILVEHISYLTNQLTRPPFSTLEALIRHTHSLAKSFPEEVGRAFRAHLRSLQEGRPTAPSSGDLMVFTAISSIFPVSDHFHQVVTPAILSMARYLSQKLPQTLSDLTKGSYVATLCLQYQQLSKRYVPEVVNYVLNALSALSPKKPLKVTGHFPHHDLPSSLQIQSPSSNGSSEARKIRFWDIDHVENKDLEADEELKIALLQTNLKLIDTMTELWVDKSAVPEIFDPFLKMLEHLLNKSCLFKLCSSNQVQIRSTYSRVKILLQQALANRKPLRLHNHRPLAIKTAVPKFEESYNPDKHYDPDRDRAEMSKLKAEHKRERKGALRELRKDANFMARENLKEKKERDSQYEKKYKRLIAEIQGEEGKEANAYEREKRMRKGKK